MNTSEIISRAQQLIQDSSYERQTLLSFLNRGQLQATRALYLPKLQAKGTVTAAASTNEVALPADFHHSVYRARNTTKGKTCHVFYNRLSLEDYYDEVSQEGDVEAVAEEGDRLHFRLEPPEDQTIEIQYYTKPTELSDSTSSAPDSVPDAYHEQIFVNYLAWSVYTEIEDDIEGNRKNTQHYRQEYMGGVQALKADLPDPSRPRRKIPRHHIYF